MATFYLANTVRFGNAVIYAGTLVNDAVDDAAAIQSAGGQLLPSTNALIATAALFAQKRRRAGAGAEELDSIMAAAVTQGDSDFGSQTIKGGALDVGSGAISGGDASLADVTATSLDVGAGSISAASFGDMVGDSLDVGAGAISGGAISGSSLDAGAGAVTGGSAALAGEMAYDSGLVTTLSGTHTTTGAGAETALQDAPAASKQCHYSVVAIGRKGTDYAVIRAAASFETFTSANPTQVGTTQQLGLADSTAGASGWAMTIDASGANVRVRVSGDTGILWTIAAQAVKG